jgi:uncharacterized protein (DUF2336 family)
MLTEEDLLGLVREPPGAGSRTAVSRRLGLAEPVCEAVVESGDLAAMAALLRNPTARIPLGALGVLVELAGQHPSLQEPLLCRAALPEALLARLVALAAGEVLSQWATRADLQPEVAALLRAHISEEERRTAPVCRVVWTTS